MHAAFRLPIWQSETSSISLAPPVPLSLHCVICTTPLACSVEQPHPASCPCTRSLHVSSPRSTALVLSSLQVCICCPTLCTKYALEPSPVCHCTRYAPGPGPKLRTVPQAAASLAGRADCVRLGLACAKRSPDPNPQAQALRAPLVTWLPTALRPCVALYKLGPGLAAPCSTALCARGMYSL